ncbi:MAG: manganese-dependent ADP-ribose/CDP-alcohol diphosphatase [Planctomycetota bacterium]|jgi:manganese-dependent ADP-ribose/CDP-alcohol diphosphatase
MSSQEGSPLRFGVIADVQYADKETRGKRRYREALIRLEEAVAAFCADGDLDFVVQLGDLIDGRMLVAESRADLRAVMDSFRPLDVPLHHVIGNHCLSVPRHELLAELRQQSGRSSIVQAGVRIIIVDSMEFSILGTEEGTEGRAAARAWLDANMGEDRPQATNWNGGLGAAQRAWLASELLRAREADQLALVFAHHPVSPQASRSHLLAWDHAEVRGVLQQACVPIVWLAGHEHVGGYALEGSVHHLTMQGMLESPVADSSFAVFELQSRELRVSGRGLVPDRSLIV